MSSNSIDAYLNDVTKLHKFSESHLGNKSANNIMREDLLQFFAFMHEVGLSPVSLARIISGIKTFYKFLVLDDEIKVSPAELIEGPKIGRHLPSVLDVHEIETVLKVIDMSTPEGIRNNAIIEVLYGCGLRVSELVDLKLSNLFLNEEYIKVVGKGNKERLVPIGSHALKAIEQYFMHVRNKMKIKKGNDDIIFLNRRGSKLTRVMIFTILKNLVKLAGISKTVSPHTLRHSFATHLIEGGADLRVVQDLLGHESIITTEIYTHLDKAYLAATLIQFHPRSGSRINK